MVIVMSAHNYSNWNAIKWFTLERRTKHPLCESWSAIDAIFNLLIQFEIHLRHITIACKIVWRLNISEINWKLNADSHIYIRLKMRINLIKSLNSIRNWVEAGSIRFIFSIRFPVLWKLWWIDCEKELACDIFLCFLENREIALNVTKPQRTWNLRSKEKKPFKNVRLKWHNAHMGIW